MRRKEKVKSNLEKKTGNWDENMRREKKQNKNKQKGEETLASIMFTKDALELWKMFEKNNKQRRSNKNLARLVTGRERERDIVNKQYWRGEV